MQQQSGWYPDPDGTPGRLRWWDGQNWSDLTTPGPTPPRVEDDRPPQGPPVGAEHDTAVGPAAGDVISGPGGSGLGASGGWRRHVPQGARRVGALLVVVLVVALLTWRSHHADTGEASTASGGLGTSRPSPPGPPLARLCHAGAPTNTPPAPPLPGPAPSGPSLSDRRAGISYAQMGRPWQPWDQLWSGGLLGVRYQTGYFFVTQPDVGGQPGNDYLATVLSGSVPATVGDALHPDMKCVAQQVAEDARESFYPSPNARQVLEDKPITVDGHPGYVIKFHLSFDVPDYDAKGEMVSVLLVDVGTPNVAVLYQSIPDTHRQYDPVIDRINASVTVS